MSDSRSSVGSFYVLSSSGSRHGPYATEQASELVVGGHVQADTLVWWTGVSSWRPAVEHEALKAALTQLSESQTQLAHGSSFVDDDGTKYKWDDVLKRYVEDDARDDRDGHGGAASASTREQSRPAKPAVTCVYVQNLPRDASAEEVAEVFAKCGILRTDDGGAPRVKVYTDDDGRPKGDALVNYMLAPSVQLACQLLDGTWLRGGSVRGDGEPDAPLRVEEASFQQKDRQGNDAGKGSKRAAKEVLTPAEKRARIQSEQRRAKLLGWEGEDNLEPATDVTVVLYNAFDAEEMARLVEEANARSVASGVARALPRGLRHPVWEELTDDVFRGAEEVGPVEHMKVFPLHPRGAIRIRFKFPRDAARCVGVMHGRYFGGRQLSAELWDGTTNHAKERVDVQSARDADEAERLEAFMDAVEEEEEDGSGA